MFNIHESSLIKSIIYIYIPANLLYTEYITEKSMYKKYKDIFY